MKSCMSPDDYTGIRNTINPVFCHSSFSYIPHTLAQAPSIFAKNKEQCGRIIVPPMKKPFEGQRKQENNPGVSTAAFSSLTAGKPLPFTKTEKKWKGIRWWATDNWNNLYIFVVTLSVCNFAQCSLVFFIAFDQQLLKISVLMRFFSWQGRMKYCGIMQSREVSVI